MIDQGGDIPLNEVVFYLMDQVMRQAQIATREAFKQEDIPLTKDQWILLKVLNEQQDLSQRELSEATFKEPAAVTRMLDLMSKHGWVVRKPSPSDRRKFQLSVTEAGRSLYQKTLPVVQKLRLKAMHGIPQEKVDQVKAVMKLMEVQLRG